MIKNKFILGLVICTVAFSMKSALAQPFGNEWIDFNQSYFKLKIGKNGIYRITQTELANAGFPVNTIDPRRIQVFRNGQEQAITIQGQNDFSFDAADYLEFYAEINDGKTDSDLYTPTSAQPHTFYNLFSDTSAYFITYKLSNENGKRMSSFKKNNVSGLPAEAYYFEDSVTVLSSNYHEGRSYGSSELVLIPQYDFGEGFTGPDVATGQSANFAFNNITNTVTSGLKPEIEILLTGANNNEHSVGIFVGQGFGGLRGITTATFSEDDNFLVSSEIEWSDISDAGNFLIQATVNGVNGTADRATVSYVRLIYPRAFDFSGLTEKSIALQANPSGESYIVATNTPSNSTLYDITDSNNPISIGINETFQSFNAIIDNTEVDRKLWMQSSPFSVDKIEPIIFQNIDASLYNYLIVTNNVLQSGTSDGQPNPVETYKNYRESTVGGSHSVIIQNIQDIFDQFNYGLPSPIAIRRYCDFMLQNGSPEFLFIIGRAADVGSNFYRQAPGTASIQNLIPTYGYPGSDVAFTAGLAGTSIYAAIATGRINATSPDHVQNYLDKVIETENQSVDNLRRKTLIQLSGGVTQSELNLFKLHINGFKNIAEAPLLGGIVEQVSKNSNNIVELINIAEEINEGIMLVTFFGHSSAGVTDIEVGTVSDPSFGYANQGKYPVFLVNGCNAGDFFGTDVSFGVDWVLTPNLGAIGFLAHSDVAFAPLLRNYTNLFYSIGFGDENFVGKALGKIINETGARYAQSFGTGTSSVGQLQILNLQGDPAIKLFAADKPDFDIDENNFVAESFDGTALLVDTDSFYVDINVRNYGTVPSSSLNILVRRTLSNGTIIDSEVMAFTPVLNSDTLRVIIDNRIANNSGLNSFEIILDPFDEIEELNELNNSLTFDLFFATGSTQNLLPTDFGVVNDSDATFYFQSTNLLSGTRSFDFEIDTVSSFNSTYLMQQSVSADVVGLITLNINPTSTISNGQVFYWRTRFSDPEPEEDTNWVTSSFTLNTLEMASWVQSSPVQFKDFELTGLSLDTISGSWNFFSNITKFNLTTYGPNHPTFNETDTKVVIDNQNYFFTPTDSTACRDNTINLIAFDNQSTVPFLPIFFREFDQLNSLVCGRLPQIIHNYTASDMDGTSGPEVFINNLDVGDQVAIYSLGQVNFSTWTDIFKSKLEELGINRTTLDNLQDGEPVIFFGKKGSPANSAIEVIATTIPKIQQEISLNIDVTGSFGSGTLTTDKIGPALAWTSFENQIVFSSIPANDVKSISVVGVDENNQETDLLSSQNSTIDLSTVDASAYPFVKFKVSLEDPIDFTPPQLNNWKVFYDVAPEGVLINRNTEGLTSPISRQEGENLTSDFTFWNLSGANFPGQIKVNFETLNNSSGQLTKDSINIDPPAQSDSVNFTISVNTLGKIGVNDLSISINREQHKELYANNNILRLSNFFEITGDQTNPILEVSFDGLYILDGDIVSPSPNILINLKDENPYILKSDTLGINLFLKPPCDGCDYERIAFSSPEINWTNATSDTDFSVEYKPQNLSNGMYGFRIQAQDASGNNSGIEPYEINFEVINESTVTNFYPYPNPFSTSTKFVFTLTGAIIPDDIKIQIMTVTGRVVKEIFREELGAIRIGNNITDYAWDGRDNYGDQLANGVYLYRVIIQQNGQDFEKRSTSTTSSTGENSNDVDGRAFKNGFGKLYLLR